MAAFLSRTLYTIVFALVAAYTTKWNDDYTQTIAIILSTTNGFILLTKLYYYCRKKRLD
mgnify:CR=1 FL=1